MRPSPSVVIYRRRQITNQKPLNAGAVCHRVRKPCKNRRHNGADRYRAQWRRVLAQCERASLGTCDGLCATRHHTHEIDGASTARHRCTARHRWLSRSAKSISDCSKNQRRWAKPTIVRAQRSAPLCQQLLAISQNGGRHHLAPTSAAF